MAYTPFNPYQPNFFPVMQQQTPATQQGGLSPASRPVGNREEANSVPADFSGAFMVFPDITHDRVYVKRWNYQTGTADFAEYARIAPQAAPEEPKRGEVVFATVEEVNGLREQINALRDDFTKLNESKPEKEKGKKKDE